MNNNEVFQVIANNLIEFGYPDVTTKMIKEIYIAKKSGKKKLPYFVIGMFANSQLDEAIKGGLLK